MIPVEGVEAEVRAAIRRHGPIRFDQVVHAALYHPTAGFYTAGGHAGRRGDFLTSPEVGPLFGAVVARALDAWWHEQGRPAVFVVVEAGAGPGTLARSVLRAAPACSSALRYILVEPSPAQRAQQAERLPLEEPVAAFPAAPDPDVEVVAAPPPGPIVVSLPELPRIDGPCVILANELLDNLPFGVAMREGRRWSDVHVGWDGSALVEVLLPLDPALAVELDEVVPFAAPGTRIPVPHGAWRWLTDARALAGPAGRVVAIDYGRPTADLAAMGEGWLRTYRQHQRGGPPLRRLGEQDITAEVPVDLLRPPPRSDRSQADWLRAHGLDVLVEEGRRRWEEGASAGGLAALEGRSRVGEAAALTDPTGLGAFRVLEWWG